MKRRSLLIAAPACAWADAALEPKVENESSRHWHARVAAFAQEAVPAGSIVFLGDSMTERFPLAALLGTASARPLVNRGIGGDKVGGWRYWGVLDRLDALLALRPAQVVLMIGVNDLVFASTPFEVLLPSLRTLLERLQAGGSSLLVQAVLPVRGSLAPHRARIERYNAALAAEAERLRLPWLDLRFAFTDAEGLLRAELAADAVHLNDAGYRRWAEALAPRLLR